MLGVARVQPPPNRLFILAQFVLFSFTLATFSSPSDPSLSIRTYPAFLHFAAASNWSCFRISSRFPRSRDLNFFFAEAAAAALFLNPPQASIRSLPSSGHDVRILRVRTARPALEGFLAVLLIQ